MSRTLRSGKPAVRSYQEPYRAVGDAVLLCSRESLTEDESRRLRRHVETLGQQAIREAARANKCEALVGVGLHAANGTLDEDWGRYIIANAARVAGLTSTLVEALEELEACGCTPAVIEGGNTVFGTSLAPKAFGAGDFDVLVQAERWQLAQTTMERLGFRAANRRDRQTARIEYQRATPAGEVEWLEIGCKAFDRLWIPLNYTDRTGLWLSRRTLGNTPGVKVLAPDDALVVACYHASLHSYVRSPALRLQVDIDRAARRADINWDYFLEEIFAMGVPTRAFVSLRLASALLGTPVPLNVLERLHPGETRWNGIIALIARHGVLDTGRRKLTGLDAVRLDQLLDERDTLRWGLDLLLPPNKWMATRFGSGPSWRRHLTRYGRALTRWRREVA